MKSFKEFLIEQAVDHSLAKSVATKLGTSLKNFRKGTYKADGKVIPDYHIYTLKDEKTHADVHKALTDLGFKSPKSTEIRKNKDEMSTSTDAAVSSTHLVRTHQEHGSPLEIHVEKR